MAWALVGEARAVVRKVERRSVGKRSIEEGGGWRKNRGSGGGRTRVAGGRGDGGNSESLGCRYLSFDMSAIEDRNI